jgi:hypothetical protein
MGCHPSGVIRFCVLTGGVARASLNHRLSSFDAFGIGDWSGGSGGSDRSERSDKSDKSDKSDGSDGSDGSEAGPHGAGFREGVAKCFGRCHNPALFRGSC